jgi:alpha-galactosidase
MKIILFFVICAAALCSCRAKPHKPAVQVTERDGGVVFETDRARFEVASDGGIRSALLKNGRAVTLDGSSVPDAVSVDGAAPQFVPGAVRVTGTRVEMSSRTAAGLERRQVLEVLETFPNVLMSEVTCQNTGAKAVRLDTVQSNRHALASGEKWAFFGASEKWGLDDVTPVVPNLLRVNHFGSQNREGNGGGIPIAAFWTRDAGMAIGHLDSMPLTLDIPARSSADGKAEVSIDFAPHATLEPGQSYATPRMFTEVYSGDYYDALRTYSRLMQDRGWKLAQSPDTAYDVSWCGWGYLANVTPKQMLGIIPKLKEFKIRWATLDDRWFDTYGDWNPRAETFPGDSIRKVVDEYHKNGIYVQLWWLPLAAELKGPIYDGQAYVDSKVATEHPDWLILDPEGKPAKMSRQLGTLCPALPEVQQYYKHLTEKFIRDWGFDGHKLDNVFSIQPCYNPTHHHKSPQDSVNAMGEVFRVIYETTKALKPYAVTQSCPCGTPPNIAWLPFLNQAVTGDPVGSIQVRRRVKMYKGLLGPAAPVYGDHVELTEIEQRKDQEVDYGRDFASTVGTGGVVGTKFVWPQADVKYRDVVLTPEKNEVWKKWLAIYREKMLSRGEFRNLYLTGFDKPEGYAIAKDGKLYYAFFAGGPRDSYRGHIDLRGLSPGKYRVFDYVNQRELGTIDAAHPVLDAAFTGSLLLEADKL